MVPHWFAKVHPRYRTPSNALLFIGGLSVLAPLFGEQMLVWLVDAGGFAIVVGFFMVSSTFVVLRRRDPDMERPFRLRAGQPLGALAAVLSLGLAVLFLPGMPAALIWPAEWVILGPVVGGRPRDDAAAAAHRARVGRGGGARRRRTGGSLNPGAPQTTLPGFISPRGSSARFTVRISSRSTGSP